MKMSIFDTKKRLMFVGVFATIVMIILFVANTVSAFNSNSDGFDNQEEPFAIQIYPTDDASIIQTSGAVFANLGNQSILWSYPWAAGHTRRSLIKFDFSSIPEGVYIESAVLHLRQAGTYGLQRSIGLYGLNTDWSEGAVTWDNAPTHNNFASAVAEPGWSGSLGWTEWDVTEDVLSSIYEAQPNYGWLLKDSIEDSSQNWWAFYSKEGLHVPYLEITFSDDGGPPPPGGPPVL